MKSEGFHHGNLRAALIAAGAEAVEAQGPAHLSLRDLARQAGVTPMAVYRHFKDKEALLAAIANAGFAALVEVQDQSAGVLPAERLLAMGAGYAGFAKSRPGMFRLMFADPIDPDRLGPDTPAAAAFAQLRAAVAAAMPGASEEAVTRGLVRFWSTVHGFAVLDLSNRLPRAFTGGDRLAEILRPVVDGLTLDKA